jgi:hypothetical protein
MTQEATVTEVTEVRTPENPWEIPGQEGRRVSIYRLSPEDAAELDENLSLPVSEDTTAPSENWVRPVPEGVPAQAAPASEEAAMEVIIAADDPSRISMAEEEQEAVLPLTIEDALAMGLGGMRDALRLAWDRLVTTQVDAKPWKRFTPEAEVICCIIPRALVLAATRSRAGGEEEQVLVAELAAFLEAYSRLEASARMVVGGRLVSEWEGPPPLPNPTPGDIAIGAFRRSIAKGEDSVFGEVAIMAASQDNDCFRVDSGWMEEVSSLAAGRGGAWLLLAPSELSASLAVQEPVELLDQLNRISHASRQMRTVESGKLDAQRIKILQDFFRD